MADAPNPSNIQLIVSDVDGVLTDGSIQLDDHGTETKRFHVRDGFAIKAAMRQGVKFAVLTGRTSGVVQHRMAELGVDALIQGSKDKCSDLRRICNELGVAPQQTAFIGDDLIDLPAFALCGYRITVADGAPEVHEHADYTTSAAGGRGAVREAIEHILKAQGKWDAVIAQYIS